MTCEHRAAWRCPLCVSKLPKSDNADTPVHSVGGVTVRRGGNPTQGAPDCLDDSLAHLPNPPDNDGLLNDTEHNVTLEGSPTQNLVMEMRLLREEMVASRTQMRSLGTVLSKLSDRMATVEQRVNRIEERVDSLLHRFDGGAEIGGSVVDNSSLLVAVEQLKTQLNDRDQELLLNDIELSGVPEQKGEGLPHVVMTLASKLGVNLSEQDIVSTMRVGRAPDLGGGDARPRLLVVRLARRGVRDELLRAARVRRGATTEGTGLPGPSRRFYVNERLTRANRLIFRRAREAAAQLNWRFVWTRDGNVFARQQHGVGVPRHRLRTESDLVRVFGNDAIGISNDK
ncbi:uncharacterized protein LOC113233485 [Hyposmocoma kahamanoa]|uniref:uncharacterized protein LOC113233484 n=1 Tax=Hyposmocoma kahamanoa TaxID=1477025 RepID=UPI000E6D6E16|nr:uncharacterized protein LOC113233484 [Hyposmocoma kahamanoa]XP_026324397.1 uncharacterized protein LOC113233485 [Hyposmocoma kahamanoa]